MSAPADRRGIRADGGGAAAVGAVSAVDADGGAVACGGSAGTVSAVDVGADAEAGSGGTVLEPACTVCSNRHLADGIFEMTLKCPSVARRVQPGQFVHLRMPALEAHILRRPLSVSGIDYPRGELNIIYQVVGEGSLHMSKAERGDLFDVLGPIGRGWNPPAGIKRALLVAGGVGLAPLNLLIDQLLDAGVDEVQLVIGAQNAAKLFFSNAGDVDPRLKQQAMTDDGSVGRKGFVTELARELLEAGSYDYLATCGPEPMQRIVASLAREFAVPCEVSLERRMACGIGACRSCVVATTSGAKRVCVDGPVFDAQEVIW